MRNIKAITLLFIFSLSILGNFLFIPPAQARIELIKAKGLGTVYYLDSRNIRHPFPNLITYQSWYGDDFSKIWVVPESYLTTYPLGKNVTIRPGTHLVKVQTDPAVYAVEPGGVLRHLEDEEIAEAIYGPNWVKRIVDVPDVFFDNYTIGEVIDKKYKMPDGILYQDLTTKKYYYKKKDFLQPFSSTEAVLANRFKLSDAVISDMGYQTRVRPITGLDNNIFDPLAEPIVDKRDCENKNLKAAIIFLAEKDYSNTEIEKVQAIKKEIADRFSWVTDELAEIDVDYPTTILLDDGYFLAKRNDGAIEVRNEVINTFYDDNPDIFDLIFVFTNFKTPSEDINEIATFNFISNIQEGTSRSVADLSGFYGSLGKLKGAIMMGNINKYNPETTKGLNEALNIVMHEILHQWAAYIEFVDEEGELSRDLLRFPDYSHWSYYAGFISPLGGSGWSDNGDGSFTNALSQLADTNLRQYSQLDLYLMGLIPKPLMEPIMYLEPATEGALGNMISGTAKYVTIDQIIAGNGEIKCSK
jgi:hypothetical protein